MKKSFIKFVGLLISCTVTSTVFSEEPRAKKQLRRGICVMKLEFISPMKMALKKPMMPVAKGKARAIWNLQFLQ